MKKLWKGFNRAFWHLCLVDRVLILFMAILLSYTAFHLLSGAAASRNTNSVDLIIRTSASAIFGYLISGNFQRADNSASIHASSSADPSATPAENTPEVLPMPTVCGNNVQIAVVSIVGIISLVLLLFAGNYTDVTAEFSATISQLRDFVSACIGFLVSCGKGLKS